MPDWQTCLPLGWGEEDPTSAMRSSRPGASRASQKQRRRVVSEGGVTVIVTASAATPAAASVPVHWRLVTGSCRQAVDVMRRDGRRLAASADLLAGSGACSRLRIGPERLAACPSHPPALISIPAHLGSLLANGSVNPSCADRPNLLALREEFCCRCWDVDTLNP